MKWAVPSGLACWCWSASLYVCRAESCRALSLSGERGHVQLYLGWAAARWLWGWEHEPLSPDDLWPHRLRSDQPSVELGSWPKWLIKPTCLLFFFSPVVSLPIITFCLFVYLIILHQSKEAGRHRSRSFFFILALQSLTLRPYDAHRVWFEPLD